MFVYERPVAAKRTAAELRAENQMLRRTRQVQGAVSVINNLIRWGGALGIARYVYLGVVALAGHTTMADIGVKFVANVQVGQALAQALAWIFGGSGVMYGLRQRKVRRDAIGRLSPGHVERERTIDPKRSSSQLTERGETRPEDR